MKLTEIQRLSLLCQALTALWIFGFSDMALQKQYWEMIFGASGQEQRTEEKIIESPQLTELLNGEIIEPGVIRKRAGYKALEASPEDSQGLEQGVKRDKQGILVGYSDHLIGNFNVEREWPSGSTATSPVSNSTLVESNANREYRAIDVGVFYLNSEMYYIVVATEVVLSLYNVVYFVYNENLEIVVKGTVEPSIGIVSSKVTVSGSSFDDVRIWYVDGTDLKSRTLESDLSGVSSATVIASDVHATIKHFDVVARASYHFVAYVGNANYLTVLTVSGASVLYSWNAGGSATYRANEAIGIGANELNSAVRICVATKDSGSANLQTCKYDVYMNRYGYTSTAGAGTCTNLVVATGWTNEYYYILYEIADYVYVYSYYSSLAVDYFCHGNVQLLHKAIGDNSEFHGPFFGLVNDQDGYAVGYTAELRQLSILHYGFASFEPVAKFLYRMSSGLANNDTESNHTSHIVTNGTNEYVWAVNDVNFDIALCFIKYNHLNQKRFHTVNYKQAMYLAQGTPLLWDGTNSREIGFSHPPVIISSSSVGGSGSIAAGTYNYVLVFKITDSHGNVYRSPVSLPEQVVVGSGSSTVDIDYHGAVYRFGATEGNGEEQEKYPTVELYRTEAGPGDIYYKTPHTISAIGLGWYGVPHTISTYQTITDSESDANLIDNEILYTEGGELEHCAPPPLDWITYYNNRIWGIHSETGEVVHSAELVPEEGPWFHGSFAIEAYGDAGKPTAIIGAPTGLLVFWKSRIGVIYGEGPNRQGVGSSLSKPQTLVDGIGCEEVNSIVQTPKGVIFKAAKGFYLIGYDTTEPVYIGGGVYDFDAYPIGSASLIPDKHQVRFNYQTDSTSGILVYSYEFNQWYVWGYTDDESQHTLTDRVSQLFGGCAIENTHYLALDNGNTLYQDPTYWLDDDISGAAHVAQRYSMVVQTPWIKLSGLQGYQRVLKAWILGEYIGDHDLIVYIDYDYSESNTDTVTVLDSVLSTLDVYQVRIGIPNQRCQAIRFRIVVSVEGYTSTEAAKLSGLRLEYMRKRGGMRTTHNV